MLGRPRGAAVPARCLSSRNLWDYLICPLDVIFAAADLIIVTLWRRKDVRPEHVA